MIGDYAKLNGQLVKIEYEHYGKVTVKVMKTRQIRETQLSRLVPLSVHPLANRLTVGLRALNAENVCSNHTSPTHD